MSSDPSNSGAVIGAAVDTSPATTKATAVGVGSILIGLAGAVAAAVTKDPSSIHWAGILGGSLLASVGGSGTIWAHVRAAEAEVEHAITVVESGVAKIVPSLTPAVDNAFVQQEVTRQLGVLFPGIAVKATTTTTP